MSPDDPWEPTGERRRSSSPSWDDDHDVRGGRRDRPRPTPSAEGRSRLQRALRTKPARGRRVRRTVRHVDPWSVLRISLLFYAAVFLILCVASAVLWAGARASGSVDNLERFVTSVGGFGTCEPIEGSRSSSTTSSSSTSSSTTLVDDGGQLPPPTTSTTLVDDDVPSSIDGDEDCPVGKELVGEFRFRDSLILISFAFGGVVLVLAGAGASVVMALLFNLMSDITGGVQVWIVEDEPKRRRDDPGSPPPRRRG